MAGLSGKQQDILFDLIYKGSPPLIEGEMFGIKDFSLGEENAHSMIDSLIPIHILGGHSPTQETR